MVQKPWFKDMPTKSRDWLEVEFLRLAQRVLGEKKSSASQSGGCIPKGTGPDWKVADIIPQPSLAVSGKIRDRLAL